MLSSPLRHSPIIFLSSYFTFTLLPCLHSFLETSLRAAYGLPYRIMVGNVFIIITSFQRCVHFNFQTPALSLTGLITTKTDMAPLSLVLHLCVFERSFGRPVFSFSHCFAAGAWQEQRATAGKNCGILLVRWCNSETFSPARQSKKAFNATKKKTRLYEYPHFTVQPKWVK